jgi:hypothetical protein
MDYSKLGKHTQPQLTRSQLGWLLLSSGQQTIEYMRSIRFPSAMNVFFRCLANFVR